ncbi:MAG: response regulator [Chloroflexi bacterium]|nr:response regulator [Chloroflexota bacterium]
MIVENETFVLEALEDILSAVGFVPLSTKSGHEAVRIFQKHQREIDLVILDLHLPDMSGIEVLSALRRIDPDARIIISSGYSEREILEQLRKQQATILRKPYNAQLLLDCVHRELGYQEGRG